MAKSKWEQVKDKLVLVEGWARDGLTDEQIAKNLGIGKNTFYQYKKEHQDFSDSLKKGKEVVDFEVENALLKRAKGYTTVLRKGKVTKFGDVVEVESDLHGERGKEMINFILMMIAIILSPALIICALISLVLIACIMIAIADMIAERIKKLIDSIGKSG